MKKTLLFLLPVAFCVLGMSACGNQKDDTTWTVTWNYNYDGAPSNATTKVDKSTAVAKPTDPTRENYTFTNWYTEDACTNIYNFDTLVEADITLYAGWKDASSDHKISLAPSIWNVDSAWFAAYCWTNDTNAWFTLTASGDYFSAEIDTTAYSNIIFVRMASTATTPAWNTETITNVWNQTSDLTFGGNLYTITGWGDESTSNHSIGAWSTI